MRAELISISKALLIIGRILIIVFLKTGITEGSFQQEGKQDSARHFLKSLVKIGESSGEHFCKTMTGIPSGPVALEESRSEIIEATVLTEKLTWFNQGE